MKTKYGCRKAQVKMTNTQKIIIALLSRRT